MVNLISERQPFPRKGDM